MSALREKIFECEGEGLLKPKNTDLGHIEIPVMFTCAQYSDGIIDGTITLIEEDHTQYYIKLFHPHKDTKFSLSANLGGKELNIKELICISYHSSQTSEIIVLRDITFIAEYLKIKNREISSATNKIFCSFDVSNLKSFMTIFEIEEGKVTFFNYEGEVWKDIELYKKSGITGCVQMELNDVVRLPSIEAYKSLLFKKIDKILRLASLSQGTCIDWASFELFEQNNESEYEEVYAERRNISSAFSVRHELTPYIDLSNYFKKTYPNYTDNLDTDLGFYFAFKWYLESLNRSLLESKYLGLFTVLETFIYRFATTQKPPKEFILDNDDFKRFKENLKETMKGGLSALSIDTNKDMRNALYSNLSCLNRYSFRYNLTMFLRYYKIGYSDIIEDLKDLGVLK
ncbi:hypothetical protein C5S36_03930, partial [Candidatus Methanophagaceae archaeon]